MAQLLVGARPEARGLPIVNFPYAFLSAALARGASRAVPDRAAVVAALADLGCAIDGPDDGPSLAVEALMNRPDLFSLEGVARALRPFLGLSPSPAYPVAPGPVSVTVDPSVLEVRPEIACAVVRGVELTAEGLGLLLDAQEKLDLTYGRKRSRVSIGLHDLAPLVPPITYRAAAPSSASFVPLLGDALPGGPRALNLQEILERHPKGQAYGHILAGARAYPLLEDARGAVLSFPPIINGTLTELKPGRRDIFVDVTGTSRRPVLAAAGLLAMLLAERGGAIESVEVRRPGEEPAREPDLTPSRREVALARASLLVGAPLRADEAASALERMGHRCLIVPGGRALDVHSPPWRLDLLHEVDLIEDIAIGLGYRSVPGSLPRVPTIGSEHVSSSAARRARAALLGLGFLEVMTLTLTSPSETLILGAPSRSAASAGGPDTPFVAATENPITREHSALRASLVPNLLAVLSANTHRDLPQSIFEVGETVVSGRNLTAVAGAYLGADASYTRAKGIAQSLCRAFGLPENFAEAPPTSLFTPGRAACLRLGEETAGAFGEIAPAALARFGLVHPAFAFEFPLLSLAAPAS